MDTKYGIYLCIQICIFAQLASFTCSQSQSSPAPQCYNTTTCPCCKNGTCPSDRYGSCGGNCIDGYHGGKCWNECPRNCTRCVDAPQGGGVSKCTQCKEGYYSTQTQYQCQLSCSSDCKTCESNSSRCTSCEAGYYITPDDQCAQCHVNCTECISSDKCISCMPGYYPQNNTCYWCDSNCDECLAHPSCSCTNGCLYNSCNASSGLCIFGCKENFASSEIFRKCDICKTGLYGYDCRRKCSRNCLLGCDWMTGVCSACQPGFFGLYCANSCPPLCLSTCKKASGQCDGCLDGYYGINCTMKCMTNCKICNNQNGKCTVCVDGFYGEDCDNHCSEHCILNECDKLNGSCECALGYEGGQCRVKVTTTTTTTTTTSSTIRSVVEYSTDSINVEAIVGLTLGVVVVLVLAVVAVVLSCRRFSRRHVSKGVARVDLVKLRVEIATIEAALATEQPLDDSKNNDVANLQIRLEELQRKLPYYHSEKADHLATESTYEQLQRHKHDDTPYASMKPALVTTEETSEDRRNDYTVAVQSENATQNAYERLQVKDTDETPYASLKP